MSTSRLAGAAAFALVTGAVAATYAMLAQIGFLAAIEPGNVTLVWPPAGFGVAAVLALGARRVALGIWLGSFLANILVLSGDGAMLAPLVAATIALGSAIQLAVAGAALRRSVAWVAQRSGSLPAPALPRHPVAQAALFAGVAALACLIAPTLGVATLWQVGLVEPERFLTTWAVWWVGDWAGIVIFGPSLIGMWAWLRQREQISAIALLAIDMGIVIAGVLFFGARALEAERIRAEFTGTARAAEIAIAQSIGTAQHDLEAVDALFGASASVTPAEFRAFTELHFDGTYATLGAHGLGWAPRVRDADRTPFEAALRALHGSSIQITEGDALDRLARAGQRPEYSAITYIEPAAGNRALLGYDLESNPEIAAALAQARDTGTSVATRITALLGDGHAGFYLVRPLYQGGQTPATLAERRASATGALIGIYHVEDLITAPLINPDLQQLEITLVDQSSPGDAELIYSNQPKSAGGAAAPPAGVYHTYTIDIGRSWLLIVRPTRDYFAQRRTLLPWGVLLGSLCLTALGAMVMIQRQRAAQAARRGEQRISALVEKSATIVTLVDRDGRVAYGSPNYAGALGYGSAPAGSRHLLDLIAEEDRPALDELLGRLRGLPGASLSAELRVRHADGGLRWLACSATNLLDDPQVQAIVVNFNDIDQVKRAERELITLREAVSTSFETIFLTDRDGLITWVNPAFTRMYGYPAEEAVGKATPRILKSGMVPPEQITAFWETILRGQTVQDEIVNRTRDGALVTIDRSVSPVRDARGDLIGFLSIQRDISERKRLQEREAEQRALLEQVLQLSKALAYRMSLQECLARIYADIRGGLGFDRVGLFLYEASGQVRGVLGTTRVGADEDLGWYITTDEGTDWREALRGPQGIYISENYAEEHQVPHGHALEGVRQHVMLAAWADDQPVALIAVDNLLSGRPITPEQREALQLYAGYAGLAIANARWGEELERMVAERTDDLSRANSQLTKALTAKDEFLANMSHELRTPLNAILTLSESLSEHVYGPLSAEQSNGMRLIESSGQHLLALINDILDLSKIEAGQLELQLDPAQIDEVCKSSLMFIKELAHKKGLRVTFQCNDTSAQALVDARRLKQILVNLLSNAVKFTPSGGSIRMDVDLDSEQELVRFVVRDSGIGIAADDIVRLFRPFTQLDSSLSRQYEGTGLGLALVHRLTEMHGGSVSVASPGVGQGSTFTVRIPWRHADGPAAMPADTDSPEAAPQAARGTVLVAEDNETNIAALGTYLAALGYGLVVARNGAEAIERALAERPDIILMDIQMPVMDGLEAIRWLRAQIEFAATPIIALTALAMPGDRERCMAAGASAYVTKPVGLRRLAALIEQALAQPRPSA